MPDARTPATAQQLRRAVGVLDDGTPYFAPIGELPYDGAEDRVQCHLCGGWFRQVGGSHLQRTHAWTMERYRSVFRLPKRVATSGRGLSEVRRAQTIRRIDSGELSATGRFGRDRDTARAAGARSASHRTVAGIQQPLSTHQQLMAEWHSDRNRALSPDAIGVQSTELLWWRCRRCGHEWQATARQRTVGAGCPDCYRRENGRMLREQSRRLASAPGRSRAGPSLPAARPDLIAEWHPTRNGDLEPSTLTAATSRKVWWVCAQCGHEWEAQVGNRVRGTGCPVCAIERIRVAARARAAARTTNHESRS